MKRKKFKGGLKRRLDNAEFEVHTGVRYKKPEKNKRAISKPTLWSRISDWLNRPMKGS